MRIILCLEVQTMLRLRMQGRWGFHTWVSLWGPVELVCRGWSEVRALPGDGMLLCLSAFYK